MREIAQVIARFREAGLKIVPHAGETVGPESIWGALEALHPDRIAHGVRCVEDPALIARLAADGIPCDVCPTSNVRLNVVTSLAEHPLPRMIEAGVPVTLNSDDQLFFGSDIAGEYALARDVLGLSDGDLAAIARTSLRASSASPGTVSRALKDIDHWCEVT